ncbi:hypothetical protein [Pseudomonas sp. OV226]|uniref:hypothetical protein n=1 Tax=Pseudomonas sp. OV226 TaxID=2135588 RepID=UPI000D6CA089|nr:hypothetical protein [Pseudomonas sp. OV226]PWK31758.1 hypothetical protein C7534_12217 [Pseudomonas sp. OV226]
MAKIDATNNAPLTNPEPLAQPASVSASTPLKFRDKVYTSRQLILPETRRTLPVLKGVVEVPDSDIEAVRFLKAHEEFEPLG